MDRAEFDLQAPFQPAGDQPKAEVENLAHLEKIIRAARRVSGVTDVARRERLTTE
jgi:excinuclease UvrABC helicase subunit UvrB